MDFERGSYGVKCFHEPIPELVRIKEPCSCENSPEISPYLINKADPWLSSSGIETGARWNKEISESLEATNVGIICVTPENRNEPWILFEAGAIAKLTTVGRAMVLRIGLAPSDITGPLAQFQSVSIDREGIQKLVTDINKSMEEPIREASLEITFNGVWPQIEKELAEIESRSPVPAVKPRSTEDMLKEILELGRRQEATLHNLILTFSQPLPLMSSAGPSLYGSSGYGSFLYGTPDPSEPIPLDRLAQMAKSLSDVKVSKGGKPVAKS